MHFRFPRKGKSQTSSSTKSKKEKHHEKLNFKTNSLKNPILEAMQEAQPFEQAAAAFDEVNSQSRAHLEKYRSFFTTKDGIKNPPRNIFGQVITEPDFSNPTRSRNERPLDTIRGFEYAISGNPLWKQDLETPIYGFNVRPCNRETVNPLRRWIVCHFNEINEMGDEMSLLSEKKLY